ncbi:MAG: hypothetical protein ACK4GT_12075 [Pararhodobacter sp.]
MNTPTQPASGPGAKAASTVDPSGKATEKATEAGRALWEDTKDEALHLKDEATGHVRERAEDVKDTVADEMSSVGDALRKASKDLREGSVQEQLFGNVAESLASFADAVRGKDVSEIVETVSSFGRRNPGAFLGGAALLGFAAVRMARASESGRSSSAGNGASRTSLGASRPQVAGAEQTRQPAPPIVQKAEI